MSMSTREGLATAVSLDAELAERLRIPRAARVHSVFRRVVNLVIEPDGRLVSLCTGDLDDAPWSVRVDVADWEAWNLEPGDAAELDATGIRLPNGTIHLVAARTWTPAPPEPWEPAERHIAALRQGVRADSDPDPFTRAVSQRVAVLTARLADAETDDDAGAVRAAVEGLLGLGAGLTPTGDDVLTGILMIAARPGSRIALTPRAVLTALADDPHGSSTDRRRAPRSLSPRGPSARTTAVSVATLGEAARGRARQSILDLLHDLATEAAEPRIAPVLAIGHTSGSDIVAGLVAGIHLEQQLRGTL